MQSGCLHAMALQAETEQEPILLSLASHGICFLYKSWQGYWCTVRGS